MTIDIDPESQGEIDAEEAALAEAYGQAAEVTGKPAEDGELKRLYEALEKVDRKIVRVEEVKKESAKEFRDELNELNERRKAILDNIAGYRAGERGLPFDDA